jgi:hypothetical protein
MDLEHRMRTAHLRVSATVLALALGGMAVDAEAVPIIDTTAATVVSTIYPFGETTTSTIGQTFTVTGPETQLNSFAFRLDDSNSNDVPVFVNFAAYLYAWDGTRASGPQLFASGMLTSSNNGGAGGYETFSFDTGGVSLLADQQYVAFLSASQFFTGGYKVSTLELNNGYSGGSLVYDSSGNNFDGLTAHTWQSITAGFIGSRDTWFVANFSPPANVPEPGTAALLLAATGILVYARRRKLV